MEGSKSFSIDALLARDRPSKRTICTSSPPPSPTKTLRLSPPPMSPISHKSSPGSLSPTSVDESLSPGRSADSPCGRGLGTDSQPGSPPLSGGHSAGGILAGHRPGLLSPTGGHPVSGAPGSIPHSMLHGMFPAGHPVYTYNGHPLGQGGYPVPMLNGSAFHLPPDHAFKAAQLGVHMDWFTRAGMLMPRPIDYAGKSQIFTVLSLFIIG